MSNRPSSQGSWKTGKWKGLMTGRKGNGLDWGWQDTVTFTMSMSTSWRFSSSGTRKVWISFFKEDPGLYWFIFFSMSPRIEVAEILTSFGSCHKKKRLLWASHFPPSQLVLPFITLIPNALTALCSHSAKWTCLYIWDIISKPPRDTNTWLRWVLGKSRLGFLFSWGPPGACHFLFSWGFGI